MFEAAQTLESELHRVNFNLRRKDRYVRWPTHLFFHQLSLVPSQEMSKLYVGQ